MTQLVPSNRAAPAVDSRSLTQRLALAPVSELPAAIAAARAAMTGANPEWISGRVAALLSHYWRPDDPDHLAEAVIVDWIEALMIYPQWAISAAVLKWNRTSGGKRPAPSHIAALCEEAVAPMRNELAKARSVLSRVQELPRPRVTADRAAAILAEVAARKRVK